MTYLRSLTTLAVFSLGVCISYFLCDFYNDINDTNRINFSKQESNTLQQYVGDALLLSDKRGYLYASALKLFPSMSESIVTFRDFASRPGVDAFEVGDIYKPPIAPGASLENPQPPPFEAFHYVQRVEHKDREEFEKNISAQYNQSIKIRDYTTDEVLGERDEYWVVYFHNFNVPVIGRDILTSPERKDALEYLMSSGNISYTTPLLSRLNVASYSQFFEIITTPQGQTGVVLVYNVFKIKIDGATNSLQFLKSGNGGRRLTLHQIHTGVSNVVYDYGSVYGIIYEGGSNGPERDLIYEGVLPVSDQVSFVMRVYENTTYDNSEETFVFMTIGVVVSFVLATWEFFRHGASIRAEESSNAKSKFLSNISHEIRTPINGIVGITDVLSKEILPEVSKNYVRIIESCSSSLLNLLNNVLDMSKIDAGKLENNKTDFVMKTLILRTVRDAWEVLVSKNSKIDHIKVVLTKTIPTGEVFGQATHIFQIINNLLSNAVKFTDEGYVEVKVDAKQKTENSMLVTLAVRDTGIGMDEKAIKKLFKPFNRVHNGSNEKAGTGLGLVISMFLSKNMGGGITCESVVGEGTTFVASLILPGKVQPDGKEEVVIFNKETSRTIDVGVVDKPQDITCKVKEGTKILIVDDNGVNRMVLRKMLESINASDMDEAGDGEDALKFTRVKKYDLIFMDKFMPVMDGVIATKHIRSDSDCICRDSPIVFLSADVEDTAIAVCMEAGANGFLPKPYKLFLLLEKIRRVAPDILVEGVDIV